LAARSHSEVALPSADKDDQASREELLRRIKARAIEYVLISFVDLAGVSRAKLVPVSALEAAVRHGVRFSAAKVSLGLPPSAPDIVAVPDLSSFIQLPWRKEAGWLAADLFLDGAPLSTCPRQCLKGMQGKAAAQGWVMKHGVECEFIVVSRDVANRQLRPSYNQAGLMRRYDLLAEICDAVLALGWEDAKIEQENAHGQFEINWRYDHSLITADRHAFFKYMAKSIGERRGLRITFIPLFFTHIAPTGCHAHISLWDGDRNIFDDANDPLGLSHQGYHFLGGVMNAAASMCALTNPTVNSYRRLNRATGAQSVPLYGGVTYAGRNRTHIIRIPSGGRFEFRLPDGAASPYLLPAAVLAAGLDGIAQGAAPGPPLDIHMHEEGHMVPEAAPKLPLNLLDALRAFEASGLFRDAFGAAFTDAYAKLKMAEWTAYARHITDWEHANALDC
jgi:glutamate---methylamine ligase